MISVLKIIEKLKQEKISKIIFKRMGEFEELGKKSIDEIFSELCFCILTANFSAEGGIKIQNSLGKEFIFLPEQNLAEKLKYFGHRFPNTRAKFIVEARNNLNNLMGILNSSLSELEKREWLVENIKGIGMKEASHFLRNIGYKNVAIIDFHIIDFLVKNGLIEVSKSKSLSIKKYLEIESILRKISENSGLNLGELDLYLWYSETGKTLK